MKRRIGGVLTAAILTVTAAACGGTPSTSPGASPSEHADQIAPAADTDPNAAFRWAHPSYPGSWDPVKSPGGAVLAWYYPVYDRLFDLSYEGTPEPMLAEDFEVADDNLSVTLSLRQGLTFSDGTPFDAAAAKFSLDRAAAQGSTIASEIPQYVSSEVLSSSGLKIEVSGSMGAFLSALTARPGVMVSPTAAAAGVLDQGPVGVGPYVAHEINVGESVVYSKVDGYWAADAQGVAELRYQLMADDQTRLNALQTGEIDGAYLSTDQISSAVDLDLQVLSRPSTTFDYLVVNSNSAPFNTTEGRLALNYAIDRVEIADGLFDGYCTPQVQPWPESSPAYNEEIGDGLDIWPHDPEKAKELLQDAGASGDISLTMITLNITAYQKLGEVLQSQLGEVGINVTLKSTPGPQLIEEYSLKNTAEMSAGPYTGYSDPLGVYARFFAPGGTYNVGQPVDDSIGDASITGAGPADPTQRKALYEPLMQTMIDNPTHLVPICMEHRAAAFGQNVSGVQILPSGAIDIRNVVIGQ